MWNQMRPVAGLMAGLALLLAAAPAPAQGLRTVVVPAESGVVVAPRSAPPRLVARPRPPAAPAAPGPVVLPATGIGLAGPGLVLVPLLGGALFAAGSLAGGGGGGSSGPARTR